MRAGRNPLVHLAWAVPLLVVVLLGAAILVCVG